MELLYDITFAEFVDETDEKNEQELQICFASTTTVSFRFPACRTNIIIYPNIFIPIFRHRSNFSKNFCINSIKKENRKRKKKISFSLGNMLTEFKRMYMKSICI